jgi:hypothetical protein
LLYIVFSCWNQSLIIQKKVEIIISINQGTLKRKNLDPIVNIPGNNNGIHKISKGDYFYGDIATLEVFATKKKYLNPARKKAKWLHYS